MKYDSTPKTTLKGKKHPNNFKESDCGGENDL